MTSTKKKSCTRQVTVTDRVNPFNALTVKTRGTQERRYLAEVRAQRYHKQQFAGRATAVVQASREHSMRHTWTCIPAAISGIYTDSETRFCITWPQTSGYQLEFSYSNKTISNLVPRETS
jgi:hypothetical protein